MNYEEIIKQSKDNYVIATLPVETGVDGGWEVCFSRVDTIKNIIDQLNEIKDSEEDIWVGILRDGDYFDYEDLINHLEFEIIPKAEADILIKYDAFSETTLSLDV